MESVLANELVIIESIQKKFFIWDKLMLLLSEIGSPGASFHFVFPLSYYISPKAGLMVLWTACLSEYFNAILKWLLHGERPYWWFPQHKNLLQQPLKLKQFYLTCETGPGSPSGHCMVTAACWCVLILTVTKDRSKLLGWPAKFLFLLGMVGVGLSRCYIAAHFPHQVVAGILTGVLLSHILTRISFENIKPITYLVVAGGLYISALIVRTLIDVVGIDPNWSEGLAKKYCENSSWVHMSTNLMAAIIRTCVILIGAAIALFVLRACFDSEVALKPDKLRRFGGICLSLLVNAYLHHCVSLNDTSVLIYYIVSSIRLLLVPIAAITMVPLILKLTVIEDGEALTRLHNESHNGRPTTESQPIKGHLKVN